MGHARHLPIPRQVGQGPGLLSYHQGMSTLTAEFPSEPPRRDAQSDFNKTAITNDQDRDTIAALEAQRKTYEARPTMTPEGGLSDSVSREEFEKWDKREALIKELNDRIASRDNSRGR